ncbi:MAG: hypothetical protein ACQEXB_24460 [Bacillota bacterium]
MSGIITMVDNELGGIMREYKTVPADSPTEFRTTKLEPTDVVVVDGERYRMVDRKAEVGEGILVVDAIKEGSDKGPFDNGHVVQVTDVYFEGHVITRPSAVVYHGEYRVLEPLESEETPQKPSDPLSEPPLTAYKIVDALTELSKTVAQQQREIDRLKQLTEENAKNTLTLAQDLEEKTHDLGDKIEMALGDIVTLDERTSHLTQQTRRADLVAEFIMGDIVVLAEKIGKLRGEK